MTQVETDGTADDGWETAVERVARLSGKNVLVTGPAMAGKGAFVRDVIDTAQAEERDALLITATRSEPRLVTYGSKTAVIDCSPAEAPESGRVTNVASPSDLTGISMPVSQFMKQAAPRPVVAVDSVSTLLLYADRATVFRFLSVLTTQVGQVDGIGLFTLEQGVHDEKTVRTFQQLFDGRVTLSEEGVSVEGLAEASAGPTSG